MTVDETVHNLLMSCGKTLAIAESMTAGLISATLANHEGCSKYLVGAVVTYANRAKTSELGVPSHAIETYGVVSNEVARFMATGVSARFGTDLGLAITGYASPGSDGPCGKFHVAVYEPTKEEKIGVGYTKAAFCREYDMEGDRQGIRMAAVGEALRLVGDVLEGKGSSYQVVCHLDGSKLRCKDVGVSREPGRLNLPEGTQIKDYTIIEKETFGIVNPKGLEHGK